MVPIPVVQLLADRNGGSVRRLFDCAAAEGVRLELYQRDVEGPVRYASAVLIASVQLIFRRRRRRGAHMDDGIASLNADDVNWTSRIA